MHKLQYTSSAVVMQQHESLSVQPNSANEVCASEGVCKLLLVEALSPLPVQLSPPTDWPLLTLCNLHCTAQQQHSGKRLR
jgi:hypothetical protein